MFISTDAYFNQDGPWTGDIPVSHGTYFYFAYKEGLLAANNSNIVCVISSLLVAIFAHNCTIACRYTWGNFRMGFLPELLYPMLSACLWMAGIALYSSGTTYLGSLGVSIGFAVFMITMIVSGQFTGLITGEWRLMQPRTYVSFAAGVGLLILAVLTIGLSKYFEA